MSGIINNAEIAYTYTVNGTDVSGIWANDYQENVIREGFKEVFANEFGAKEVESKIDMGTGGVNIQLFSRPRTRATPAPQIKAVPPPSQPTKPIINEQGRVKRAFDFND